MHRLRDPRCRYAQCNAGHLSKTLDSSAAAALARSRFPVCERRKNNYAEHRQNPGSFFSQAEDSLTFEPENQSLLLRESEPGPRT
jgi:hypothetical protein